MSSTSNARFDALAQNYDQPHAVLRADAVAAAIRRQVDLSPEMDVLDFGAGTGLVALALQPYIRGIAAVDSSQGMLDMLRQKTESQGIENVTPVLCDRVEGCLPDSSFDLIYSAMTMHHILEVRDTLRAFHRMLRPGGILAIADLDAEDGSFHPDKTGVHHFGFERSRMKQLLKEAGFRATAVTTAHTASKEVEDGEVKEFSVFLITGQKIDPH
jgi:ubiquinone/menaquinone biosynthesis C-methylase UbiE